MSRIALIFLVFLTASSDPGTRVLRGPPLVCHEIDIGPAPSLPWKSVGYGMGPEPTFAREKVIPETLRVLASSDEAVVHMETLRRAYIYLMFSSSPADMNELGEKLKTAVLDASLPTSPTATPDGRRETLAWFDLAYLVAIVNNNGCSGCNFMSDVPCHRFLERAARAAPNDAGVQFGVGIGQAFNWFPKGVSGEGQDGWRVRGWQHLDAAVTLVKDTESLPARNLISFFHTGYGPTEKPATLDTVRKTVAAETRPK